MYYFFNMCFLKCMEGGKLALYRKRINWVSNDIFKIITQFLEGKILKKTGG